MTLLIKILFHFVTVPYALVKRNKRSCQEGTVHTNADSIWRALIVVEVWFWAQGLSKILVLDGRVNFSTLFLFLSYLSHCGRTRPATELSCWSVASTRYHQRHSLHRIQPPKYRSLQILLNFGVLVKTGTVLFNCKIIK